MRKKHFKLPINIFLISFYITSCTKGDGFILNEDFDKNTRGWIEEMSDYHNLYLDSGFYFIESRDTSSNTFRTSAGSLDKSFLFALPDKFEIQSNIKLVSHDLSDAFYGLLFNGATYDYSFNFYKSGIVEVLEYDYNSKVQYILFTDTSDYKFDDEIDIKISIDSSSFKLFIEDYEVGHSKFSVKGWQDLRLFTSKQSKIAVDYLTIKEIE